MDELNYISTDFNSLSLKEKSEYIVLHHDFFKVCDSCEAILIKELIPICPFCKSYQFNTHNVKKAAEDMTSPAYIEKIDFFKMLSKRR